MSKWKLPDQKGTQLWPSATRSPVKIVVEGKELSAAQATLIKRRLEGEIGQFYMAATQNYSLGVANIQKTRKVLPGVSMQYENIQGQEVIRVHVSTKVTEQITKKETKKSPWMCAVIDLVYPDAPIESPRIVAFLTSPELAPLADAPSNIGSSYPGVAIDNYAWDLGGAYGEDPVIAFPNTGPAAVTRANLTENRASLRVDLRPFATYTSITLELWGWVPHHEETVEDQNTVVDCFLWATDARAAGADFSYLGPQSPLRIYRNPGFPYLSELFPELAGYANNWYSYSGGVVSGPGEVPQPPNYVFDGVQSYDVIVTSNTWPASSPNVPRNPSEMLAKWAPVGPVQSTYWDPANLYLKKRIANTVRFLDPALNAYDNVPPPEPPDNGMWSFGGTEVTDYYLPIFDTYVVTTYPTIAARVEAAMFKAEVADVWSVCETVEGQSFRQWEFTSKLPERFDTQNLGPATIQSFDLPGDQRIQNHFGYRLIGSVGIDVQNGSVSFTPA